MPNKMEIDSDVWSEDEAVICIPFSASKEETEEVDGLLRTFPPSSSGVEFPRGSERFELYHEAWGACKASIMRSAQSFHTPVLEKLVAFIRESDSEYDNIHMLWMQKLRPVSEIPVALVVGDDRHDLFDELTSSVANLHTIYTSTLSPANFSNIQTAMKCMIEGFIRNHDDKKRRPSASVGSHDMHLLCSWYTWLSSRENDAPTLAVLIQDLESCNSAILQDLLLICRNYCDRIPLKFILGTSSSDVLMKTLPRTARTTVKVKTFHIPSQKDKFDLLFRDAFIQSPSFPHLILSGNTVHWLRRSWGTYNGTIDSFLSHLQLVHLRHFQHPATFLWADPSTALETLFDETGDIHDSIQKLGDPIKRLLNAKTVSGDALLHSIREATDQFQRSTSASRLSFLVLLETQRYLSAISPQSNATELRISFLELLALFGDGKLETTCGKILQRVQLLTGPQLLELIDRLQKWAGDLIQVETGVSSFLSRIDGFRNAVEDTLDPMQEETKNKHPLSEKMALHLRELWDPMGAWMASPLLRVWRTVETELPIDILNPNMRDTVLSALIHPENYLLHDASQFIEVQPAPPTTATPSKSKSRRGGKGKGRKKKAEKVEEEEEEEEPVHNPDMNPDPDPDISILFSRYANAGRTINLYDWFESFAQGLEAARPPSPPPPPPQTNAPKPSGQGKARRRGGGKGGGRGKEKEKEEMVVEVDEAEEEEEGDPDGEETRKREYYARFMWSLHEMDMLGLVRWSGRGAGKKGAECVGKTVWITPEEE